MANTGNVFVGTGESVDRAGLTAWTTPGNIVSDNTTDATCNGAGSDYLVGRNCGFTIPAGNSIIGVLVRVEASEHSGGVEPLLAQLQDDAAALTGSSKSTSNEGSISGTVKAVYTYGSISDVWGASLTPTIVNDPNFGVRVWFTTSHDVRIDFITIQIEHAPAATTVTPSAVSVSTAVVAPTLIKGAVTKTPSAVTAVWDMQAHTLLKGALTRAPDPATAAWGVFTPASITNVMVIHPDAVTATFGLFTPSMVLGPLVRTPSPVVAIWGTAAPTVQTGPRTLAPTSVIASWGVFFLPTVIGLGGGPGTSTERWRVPDVLGIWWQY